MASVVPASSTQLRACDQVTSDLATIRSTHVCQTEQQMEETANQIVAVLARLPRTFLLSNSEIQTLKEELSKTAEFLTQQQYMLHAHYFAISAENESQFGNNFQAALAYLQLRPMTSQQSILVQNMKTYLESNFPLQNAIGLLYEKTTAACLRSIQHLQNNFENMESNAGLSRFIFKILFPRS